MADLTSDLCVIPDCPSERVESSDYCVAHHREYEECDMVDAVEGPDVVGKVCSICGHEKDYSDD